MINKRTNTVIISSVLIASVLALLSPSIAMNAQAAVDYGGEYTYNGNQDPNVNVQTIKCINSNVNINGVDINQFPQDNVALANEAQGDEGTTGGQNGNGVGDGLNIDNNLVSICLNGNFNGQVDRDLLSGITTTLGIN
jgi:hypothetical protein